MMITTLAKEMFLVKLWETLKKGDEDAKCYGWPFNRRYEKVMYLGEL